MDDILNRLETANEYCETSEARQLRKDAAEEIRRLRDISRSVRDYLQCVVDQSMSRNNAESIASDLIGDIDAASKV